MGKGRIKPLGGGEISPPSFFSRLDQRGRLCLRIQPRATQEEFKGKVGGIKPSLFQVEQCVKKDAFQMGDSIWGVCVLVFGSWTTVNIIPSSSVNSRSCF